MTRRERVQQALQHRQTDRPPCNVFLTQQAAEILCRHTGDAAFAQTQMDNHITLAAYDGFLRPTQNPQIFVDDFGVEWDRSGADKDIGVVRSYQIACEEDYDTYAPPPVPEAALRAFFSQALAGAGDTFRLGGIGFALFERAWSLRGMENLLADMLLEPERVDKLLDAICEYNLRVLDIALEYAWDGIHFGDDWGQQKGLIMGPALWRRFVRPRMARLYARAREKGLWVTQHSCGDVSEVLEDLVEIGLNAYNTVQPEIYDLARLKQQYAGRLAFWGAISTQRDLAHKTPEQVAAITRQTLHLMARGGGYIAAPTHAVEFDVPPENLLAMLREFHAFSWDA